MGVSYNPKIVTGSLKVFLDTSNKKCVDASQSITTSTRLKNLVDTSFEFYSPYTDATTLSNMSFVLDNGNYVYDQVSVSGGYPGWSSISTFPRVDNYTFICWFKYNYGASYQRAENIYGGGFYGATSFYLSPAGTSSLHGLLRYSDAGGTNSYTVVDSNGGNDGNWHMFASTDTGGDNAQVSKFYVDGILKQTGTSGATYDTPDTATYMTWGSWSQGYGNFGGRTNCYMYYDRVLSDDEILQTFNALRGRFGV
jgi:hypothetical protein